jgi:hypothetical protein
MNVKGRRAPRTPLCATGSGDRSRRVHDFLAAHRFHSASGGIVGAGGRALGRERKRSKDVT